MQSAAVADQSQGPLCLADIQKHLVGFNSGFNSVLQAAFPPHSLMPCPSSEQRNSEFHLFFLLHKELKVSLTELLSFSQC